MCIRDSYYVVQQLFKVPLADVGGALDGLFDFLQADAVGAKRPDVLHRDLVQLASQFQPGAYLVKEGRLQTAIQLGHLFREGDVYKRQG